MLVFFLIALLVFVLIAIMAWGALRSERTFQFPFLAAVAFAGYLLPQITGLTHEPYLPDGALAKTAFMAALCLAAAYWGYVSNTKHVRAFENWTFSYSRLVKGSAALTAIGAFFYYKVSLLSAEVTLATGGQWTGVITIYMFFSQMLTIGFVIALVLQLKRPSWATLAIVLFGLAFYLERGIAHGRRSAMIEIFLIVVMALWFNRRWAPPRWSIISGVMIGVLVVNSIGDYRSTVREEGRMAWSLSGVLEIDYLGNLERNFAVAGFDMTNALYRIEAADRALDFDFGLSMYNAFVTYYVPAQIVGSDLKNALKLKFAEQDNSPLGHTPHTGTMLTGMSEAFLSFWYLGAGLFFLIGTIANRWYRAAANDGNIAAQSVAILIAYPALLAFPASLSYFFFKFFELLIFLLPVLLFARTSNKTARSHRNSGSNQGKPVTR